MIVPAFVAEPIKNKHFTLYSDVLFKFNNHILKPGGKVKFDKLYSELTNLDPIKVMLWFLVIPTALVHHLTINFYLINV